MFVGDNPCNRVKRPPLIIVQCAYILVPSLNLLIGREYIFFTIVKRLENFYPSRDRSSSYYPISININQYIRTIPHRKFIEKLTNESMEIFQRKREKRRDDISSIAAKAKASRYDLSR